VSLRSPNFGVALSLMDDGSAARGAGRLARQRSAGPLRGAGASIDRAVAEHWGDLMAQSRRSGVALSVMDGFFAATALANNLTLVTRNVKDFTPFGVPLFNPWDE
jgi:predicted nucleic acid-binding protein